MMCFGYILPVSANSYSSSVSAKPFIPIHTVAFTPNDNETYKRHSFESNHSYTKDSVQAVEKEKTNKKTNVFLLGLIALTIKEKKF